MNKATKLHVELDGWWKRINTGGPFSEYENVETGERIMLGNKTTMTGRVRKGQEGPELPERSIADRILPIPTNISVKDAALEALDLNRDLLCRLKDLASRL